MPKPPVNPGYFDQVNYVIDSWACPCEAPWYIYIETLKPALLEAFIMFISFGWGDVARGFARPRGLHPRRTGKRKGKWARRIPKFPELGNMLGANLPGAQAVKGIQYNSLGKTLWRIDGLVQQGLFYWLVADILIDFAFNWTSLLYETTWCKNAQKGRFSHSMTSPSPSSGNRWHKEGFGTQDYQQAPPSWGHTSGFSGPNGCTVGAAVEIVERPPFPPPDNCSVQILDTTDTKVIAQSDQPFDISNPSFRIPVSGDIPPNHTFEVRSFHDSAWATIVGGFVTAMEEC